MGVAIDR